MAEDSRKREQVAEVGREDPHWDHLVRGIREHGSPQERRVVDELVHHFARDEFHGTINLPRQIGHGKSRHLPRRCREAMG